MGSKRMLGTFVGLEDTTHHRIALEARGNALQISRGVKQRVERCSIDQLWHE